MKLVKEVVMRYRYWAGVAASIILGLIFIAASLGKLPPSQAEVLVSILPESFLTPLLAQMVARWLPWAELVLGSLLIIGVAPKLMASFSSVLLAAFIFKNSWMIYHGLGDESCGCFEDFLGLPLSQLTNRGALYFDIGMLALVAIILFCYTGKFLTIRPWFFRKR
jgi:uncharacterized membrane protein YphA (DoxX/SURF4 family)